MSKVMNSIKELVKNGYKPKKAIAVALSSARKEKMAMGGLVEEDENEGSMNAGGDDEGEPGAPVYPMDDDDQGLSDNVMDAQALAEGLQAYKYKANDNDVNYVANAKVAGKKMDKSGQDQPEKGMALGNKPDLDWINAGSEEPMSIEKYALGGGSFSEEAKKAIMEKKMKRKFGMYSAK